MNIKTWRWQHVIWAVNGFVLLITASSYYLPDFPHNWRVFPPFDLSGEMNLAVWWSGMLLLAAAGLFYELGSTRRDGTARAWLAMAFIFAVLSCDEISSLHERIETFLYLPLGLVLITQAGYSCWVLLSRPETRRTIGLIIGGVGMFVAVSLQEKLEFMINWPVWARGIRVAVEEGTELLGSYLILSGIVGQRRKDVPLTTMEAIIPRPQLFRGWMGIQAFGLLYNIVICFFVLPGLTDVGRKGNPAVWYPSSIYYFLFAASFWQAKKMTGRQKIALNVMALLFLSCSAGLMYNLSVFLPGITRIVPKAWLSCYAVFYVVQMGGALGLTLATRSSVPVPNPRMIVRGLGLAGLLVLGGLGVSFPGQQEFVLLTLFTFVAAQYFFSDSLSHRSIFTKGES